MPPDPAPPSVEELLTQSGWLRRLAATLVAGEEAAEDLVQETWLAALRHPPRHHGPPRPWLARIARNLAANFRRAQARRKQHETEVRPTGPELDPAAVVAEVEAQRVLVEAVLRLEEPLRMAVVLRYSRGLDSRAIGRELGVPDGTVRWRQKHALELLRADLDRRFGERRAWHSAFAALLRHTGAGAPLASASMTLGAAALGAAGFCALLGTWWITVGSEARSAAYLPAESASELVRVGAAAPELALPPMPVAESARAPRAQIGATASQAKASFRWAPIRGRLRIEGTEDALHEVLEVRLRTLDVSVKETVETLSDGSFTSLRRFPPGFVLAEVLRPNGDTAVDHEGYFDPSSEQEWIVSVPWPTFVGGRLVDLAGEPLEKCWVELQQGGLSMEPFEATERRSAGSFAFSGLSPGPCTVIVRRENERYQFSVDVSRGPNELSDVPVPFCKRGPVRGRLWWPPGVVPPTHPRITPLAQPRGSLVLEDVASGVSYTVSAHGVERLPGVSAFEFEDVPVSDYRLTLFSEDGLRYAAPTRLVRPPVSEIEFAATGQLDAPRFRVTDEPSGQELEAWSAWTFSRGRWNWVTWLGSDEAGDVERWVLVARDHRPASGGTLESAQVDVRLQPGWSCALFFTEVKGRERLGPLAGVEVHADGIVVARSDGDGLALVSLAQRPGKIGYALPGWVDADGSDLRSDAETMARDVLLTRE